MRTLEGKRALITGGASGIGLATARLFLEEGAAIMIGDIDGDALQAAADALRAAGSVAAVQVGTTLLLDGGFTAR